MKGLVQKSDFEPHFLAEHIIEQSLWDPKIREVGQSFQDERVSSMKEIYQKH